MIINISIRYLLIFSILYCTPVIAQNQNSGKLIQAHPKIVEESYLKKLNSAIDIQYGYNGMKRNPLKAFQSYEELCNKGFLRAGYCLGNCYLYGEGIAIDENKAYETYRKYAEFGDACSMYVLAISYRDGEGAPINEKLAKEWAGKAFTKLCSEFEKDDANAIRFLGQCYEEGFGVSQNYAEAMKCYKKAAALGSTMAYSCVGEMYYNGEGVKKDYTESLKWNIKAAELGNKEAQFWVGYMYDNGLGTKPDKDKAKKWYTLAANNGHEEAQAILNLLDANLSMFKINVGDESSISATDNAETLFLKGVEAFAANDTLGAIKWVRKAADKGLPEALHTLGLMYSTGEVLPVNNAEAYKFYIKAAEQGYAESQCNLAYLLAEGLGVVENEKDAFKWYRKAAEQGHVVAQHNLALMYNQGRGTKSSATDAFKWFQKAAMQGYPSAQNHLAIMLNEGKGTKQDKKEALKWWQNAAENECVPAQYWLGKSHSDRFSYIDAAKWLKKAAYAGFAPAQEELGSLYEKGNGVSQDIGEALGWYCLAAEQGNAHAMYNIGYLFYTGKGVNKDYSEAFKWWLAASEDGEVNAMYSLGILYEYGKGVPKNMEEAMKWFSQASQLGYELATREIKLIKKTQRLQRIMEENMAYRRQKELEQKSQLERIERDREAYAMFIDQQRKAAEQRYSMVLNIYYNTPLPAQNYEYTKVINNQNNPYNPNSIGYIPSASGNYPISPFGNSHINTGGNAYSNNSNQDNYLESVLRRARIPGGYDISPFPTVDPELDKKQKEEYYKSIAMNYAVNGREKVPNPIPTKPLATINDFPAQTNRYETNDRLKIITVDIKRYNNYQKAYVKVSDVLSSDYCEWDFMICADGTLLEDPSEYRAFKNSKNLNFTLKLNKGYRTVTYNGQTLNKVSQGTLQMHANALAENSKIQHEIFMMNYNSQKSSDSKSDTQKHGVKWVKCSNPNCVEGFDRNRVSTPVPSSSYPPHPHPGGYNCRYCKYEGKHYHSRCPSCLPNPGRETQRY